MIKGILKQEILRKLIINSRPVMSKTYRELEYHKDLTETFSSSPAKPEIFKY